MIDCTKIIFYLSFEFIEHTNAKVFVEINRDACQKFQLQKSEFDEHIYITQISLPYLNNRKIQDYSFKVEQEGSDRIYESDHIVNPVFNVKTLGETVEVFDVPKAFTLKQQQNLEQIVLSNQKKDLFTFIQNKVKISTLLNLHEQLKLQKSQHQEEFLEQLSKVIYENLQNADSYCIDISQILRYIKQIINKIHKKIDLVIKILNYYSKFNSKIENKRDVEKQLKQNIFDKIEKLEQRLEILQNQQFLTEQEAKEYLNQNQFQNQFTNQFEKVQDLLIQFSNTKYKQIAHQLRCKIVERVIQQGSIIQLKQLSKLNGFSEKEINTFKQRILVRQFKNQSLSNLFDILSELKEIFKINHFEMRNFIKKQIKDKEYNQLDKKIIYDYVLKYDINISNYKSQLIAFTKSLIEQQQEFQNFFKSSIDYPFIKVTIILEDIIYKMLEKLKINTNNSLCLDFSNLFNYIKIFLDYLQQIQKNQQQKLFQYSKNECKEDDEILKQQLAQIQENETYLKDIRETILDEKQIKEFNDNFLSKVKTCMKNLGFRNLCDIQRQNEINNINQFNQYFNEIIQEYKVELQTEKQEQEFLSDYEFFFKIEKKTEQINKILQAYEQIALQRLNQLTEDHNKLFDFKFISQFLINCNQQSEFYKTLKTKVEQISKQIEQLDFFKKDFDQLLKQQYANEIFEKFNKNQKYMFQAALKTINNTQKAYNKLENFFKQFENYFQNLLSHINYEELKIKQIKEEIKNLDKYTQFADIFFKLMESQIMQKIFQKLKNQNENKLVQEVQDKPKKEQQKIREDNFHMLIKQFKENILNLYNYIFQRQDKDILISLQEQLDRIKNEQQSDSLNQQILKFQSIINVKYFNKTETLFKKEISFQDLEEYCEKGQTHQNIQQLCKIIGKNYQEDEEKLTKIQVWNCIFQTKYQKDNLILRIAEIFNTNKESPQNNLLFEFISKHSKHVKSSQKEITPQTPFYELYQVDLSREVKEAFLTVQNLSNIYTNLRNVIQSQNLISQAEKNKQEKTSFYELRFFVGRDQHDLSVYLSSLHQITPFLLELKQKQNEIVNNNGYILSDITKLNQFIENNSNQTKEWTQIVNDIRKLEKIQSGLNQKKIYLDLLKNFFISSKIQIKIPKYDERSTFIITCDNNQYTEQKIKEMNQRVLINKSSKNSQQNTNQAHQEFNYEEEINNNNIENFKSQLQLVDEIKLMIQSMSDFGYFLFDEETFLFQNSNKNQKETNKKMENLKNDLEKKLIEWKQNIQQVIQKYPKFSLVSYTHYLNLNDYFKGKLTKNTLSQSLQQILLQINSKQVFEPTQKSVEDYEQSLNKLEFIAKFITNDQIKKDTGGMMQFIIFKIYFFQIIKYIKSFQIKQKKLFKPTFYLNRIEKKVNVIKYQNSLNAIEMIFSYEKDIQNYKSEYFLFFDKHSNYSDLQLFLYRYMELDLENKSQNFYLIISCKLKAEEMSLLKNLKNNLNTLNILVQEQFFNSYYNFNELQIQETYEKPHLNNHFQSAVFYTSKVPGVGKSQQINQEYKRKNIINKSLVRIPLCGNNSKEIHIKQLQKNMKESQSDNIFYHLDLYETEEIDINFLLFEMIILKSINFNQREYINLGQGAYFFVEINNTINQSLENQILIKKYFQNNEIEFKIDKLSYKILQEKNLYEKSLFVYKYLNGISEVFDNYFDNIEKLDQMKEINKIDIVKLANLLNRHFILKIRELQAIPNFQQVLNFINMFGSEMMMFEKSNYLFLENINGCKELQTVRTDIVKYSLQMCQKLCMSCLQKDSTTDYSSLSIEQTLSKKTEQLLQFEKLITSFVTFQEQDSPCLTFFFQNETEIPQTFKYLLNKYQKQSFLSCLPFQKKIDDISYKDKTILLFNNNVEIFLKTRKEQNSQKFKEEFENMIIEKDNFFKIATTYLRIRSNIPVIFMGETGIGKTALIKYISYLMDAIFESKTIHAGVTEKEMIDLIESLEVNYKEQLKDNKKIILFLDEANTSSLISGLFKEIIVDRHLKGRKLNKNIIPIAAINPYRLKTPEQKKIFSYLIQDGIKSDFNSKFKGTDLEYNVFPLSQSFSSFLLNFGKLSKNDEDSYITQMIQNVFKEIGQGEKYERIFIQMVSYSQERIRKEMGDCTSACSLRDVKRFTDFLKNILDFLVKASPPGSSKSLAIKYVILSMEGKQSIKAFLRLFPALIPIHFQGHTKCTSKRTAEVLQDGVKRQEEFESKEKGQIENLCLICFDEIGLAEISPHNPLKVLHEYLERRIVSFVSISNWPLDASKMNRMLRIYRLGMEQSELEDILDTMIEGHQQDSFDKVKKIIPQIYLNYQQKLKQTNSKYQRFHGIRDYFSVIQHIKRNIKDVSDEISAFKLIQQAYFRNFSGLQNSKELLQEQFKEFKYDESSEIKQFNPLKFIKQNLGENYQEQICRNLMIITNDEVKSIQFLKQELSQKKHKFFIGMNFSEDKQKQQGNSILNQIIGCIEEGFITVLLNLDDIYQSLYEVLNQGYQIINEKYYSKITIGADSSVIEVNKNFKLILIVDEHYVTRMDGPLLNRFEKHYLNYDDIIDSTDKEFIKQLTDQVNQLQETKKKEIQNKCGIGNQEYLNKLVSFKFKNLDLVIQDFYLQHKFKMQKTNSNSVVMKKTDSENILIKFFHLNHFSNVFLPYGQKICEKNLQNKLHQDYIDSGYHFSLQSFILNRISLQNQILQQKESGELVEANQIRQFVVFSPKSSSNIFELEQSNYDYIDITEIKSEQEFDIKISQFFSQIQEEKIQQSSTGSVETKIFDHQLKTDLELLKYDQKILIIDTYLHQMDFKGRQQIEFIMQRIDEKSETKNRNIKLQLNIIILVRVEDNYDIIPIIGNWEYYYIENLNPFIQYKNNAIETNLIDDIKSNLSLKNLIQNRHSNMYEFLNLDALIVFYFSYDFQLIEEAYTKINYKDSDKLYRQKRLNQLINAFDRDSNYRTELMKIILQKFYEVIKHSYNIDTLDSFILQYLIPLHFIDKSNSLINCILLGFKHIFVQFFYQVIYRLEDKGLIYGMNECKKECYQKYVIYEMENAILKCKKLQEVKQDTLRQQNDMIIIESREILQILQKYEIVIQNQQKNCKLTKNEAFMIFCKSAKQDLQDYFRLIQEFPEQILIDSKKENINFIEEKYLKIIKNLLFINESNQDQLIDIYMVWYIWNQEIIEISKLIEFYQKNINLKQIFQDFQDNHIKTEVSQSLKNFYLLLIKNIFESIHPKQNQCENIKFQKISLQLLNTLKKIEYSECKQILEEVELINFICNYFNEIKEISKLLCSINIQGIIKLQKDSLKETKEFLRDCYSSQKYQCDLNQKQKSFESKFLKKWSQFMQKLVILSIESSKTVKVDFEFIHLILELEKDEAKLERSQANEQPTIAENQKFQIFLHRVFYLLNHSFTIENQSEVFLNSPKLFNESIQESKQEFYTLLAYGNILQNKFYKKILAKNNKKLDFLDILFDNNFDKLNNLQQTIYMSIFKALVEKLVDSENLAESFFKEIDLSIQKYLTELNNLALQLFIVRQLFYKQKLKNIDNSYFFQNCKWLQEYKNLQNLNQQEYIQINQIQLIQNRDQIIQYFKRIVKEEIKSSKNIFNQIYNGVIHEDKYYPFNMKYQFESDIDIQQLFKQRLYQCLSCKSYIVKNNLNIVNCYYCNINININEENKLKLILNDLSQIKEVESSLIVEQGFCLKINEKQEKEIDQKNGCQALFSLLYHICFSLSLQDVQNSKFFEEANVSLFNTSKQMDEQFQTKNINKILKIHPKKSNIYDYLENQIKNAFNQFRQYIYNQCKITENQLNCIIADLLKYLLNSNTVIAEKISSSESLNQKLQKEILHKLQILRVQYCENKIFQILEKYDMISKDNNAKIQFLPKSLKFSDQYLNNEIAHSYIKEIKQNMQKEYPVLVKLLDFLEFKELQDALIAFVRFYQISSKIFSFKFEYSQAKSISLDQAIKSLNDQNQEDEINQEKEKFIQQWNELISECENIKLIKEKYDINPISGQTILLDLMYISNSKFFTFLNYLCENQNQIIKTVLDICQKYYQIESLQKLDQEIRLQFQNEEDGKNIMKPLQSISTSQIINLKNLDIFEQFTAQGFQEGNRINDKEAIQHELGKLIFQNACFIDYRSSVQIQFLNSFKEIIKEQQCQFQELPVSLKKDLDQIIDKEIVYDLLQKISTTQKFTSFDISEQQNISIFEAMKMLKINLKQPKLTRILEQLQLKDLSELIYYLQDIVLEDLVLQCKQKLICDSEFEFIETIILKFSSQLEFLKELRKIFGRYIIKMFSSYQILVKLDDNLVDSLQNEKFIDQDHVISKDQFFQNLAIKDCFALFNQVQLKIKQSLHKQEKFQKPNSKLLIEDFDEKIDSLQQNI
ncbi:hypothetical protein ABPG73_021517 [Tetrahymena malaccensis]